MALWGAIGLLLFLADFNEEGLKALEARKYAEAAALFQKAIDADPQDFAAYFHLALANTYLENDAAAILAYQKALELKPGLYQAQVNLGMVLLRQKRAGEAVPLLESAVQQKPGEYRPRFYLAEALLEAGDAAKAEAHYKAAAAADPKSAAAQLGWGRATARQERLPEAAEHYHQAAELDPSYRDELLELANIYEKAGRGADAIRVYRQFPENAGALERLGLLLLENGQHAEAIPVLEEAVRKDPTPANHLALATAYEFNQQSGKAMPILQALVQADPGNYDLHMRFGRALRTARQYPLAAQEFQKSAELKPDSQEPWKDLAATYIALKQFAGALAALDRARNLGDNSAASLYFRALALDQLAHERIPPPKKSIQLALEAYQEFLVASKDNKEQELVARERVNALQKELNRR
jgi:tetratricopeptide (TPR) repeat protein